MYTNIYTNIYKNIGIESALDNDSGDTIKFEYNMF